MTECDCGKPTSGATVCDQCAKTFSWSIVNVGSLYVDLETVETRRTRTGGVATRGSVGKSQPLPVDMRFVDAGPAPKDDKSGRPRPAVIAPAAQLRWDTENTITAWVTDIAAARVEVHGPVCAPPGCIHLSCTAVRRRRHPTHTVVSQINYIARQFKWIVSQPWATQMFDEIRNLENRLKRLTDTPPDRWYAGRCSNTDPERDDGRACTAELYASTDRGQITCHACGTVHNVSDRRDFLLEQAKDYLVTATEAAGALLAWTDYDGSETKLVDRIGKWHKRGPLQDRGLQEVNGRWRPLYRLGDLQDLLVADAQTKQTRRIGGAA